jgi:hypothetical protein
MRLFEAGQTRMTGSAPVAARTRITVERDTIMLVRHARAEQAWCPLCDNVVDVVILANEALAEFIASNDVQGWITTEKLHVSCQANGPVRICLASLLRCFEP